MAKNKQESNDFTLNDLGLMVKEGFDEMGNRLDKVESRLDKVEKSVFNLQSDVKDLKIGQEKHTKEISELKDVVHGVFRIEMMEMKKRLAVIEERLGIDS